MDPTNQPPGQPTPPWGTDPEPTPWGTDPQPEAPQPGQPTPPWGTAPEPTPWGTAPESTPPWSAPGQPGAPQPAMPGQPWPPAPQKSGGKGRRIAITTVAALLIIGGLVAFNAMRGSNDGKVLFSTDLPTAEQKCSPSNVVTTVTAATPVYATYEYTARLGSDQVTLTITKDGTTYGGPVILSVSDTSGTDCGYDPTNLSALPNWGAGTWKFTLTAAGKTVSEGSLTVTK